MDVAAPGCPGYSLYGDDGEALHFGRTGRDADDEAALLPLVSKANLARVPLDGAAHLVSASELLVTGRESGWARAEASKA